MPNAYILNTISPRFGDALSLLVEMLVQAGWSYKGSGDGVGGYSTAGKVFTHTGSGAGGWHNSEAWTRVADPENKREMVVQHQNNGYARIKFSVSAKFIGGSPSSTVVPTATDERFLVGSAGAYGPLFDGNLGGLATYKFHGMASATAPYGFWYCGSRSPNLGIMPGLMMDPVDGAQGTPGDPDPVVYHYGVGGAFTTGYGVNNFTQTPPAEGCWAHVDAAATLANFIACAPATYSFGNSDPISGGTAYRVSSAGFDLNRYNGNHEALPILYGRPNTVAYAGAKGWSKFARWTSMPRTHAFDTLDNLNWVCIGRLWLPWDGVTPPMN